MTIKSAPLHLVAATEQTIAQPDLFQSQEQNVRLIGNSVMEAAGQMLELRTGYYRQDIARMEAACTMLGIHLRAAERLRQEVEEAMEVKLQGGRR